MTLLLETVVGLDRVENSGPQHFINSAAMIHLYVSVFDLQSKYSKATSYVFYYLYLLGNEMECVSESYIRGFGALKHPKTSAIA